MKARWLRSLGANLLKGAALLEYPGNFIELTDFGEWGGWDEFYADATQAMPEYEPWLEKHADILAGSNYVPVIDLGCGQGNDSLYLHKKGFMVVSCDLSVEALKRLSALFDIPVTRQFNMLDGLPFGNGTARVIIANLSLHYFRWEDTRRIVAEIQRVLADNGHLICRVNSINNFNHVAGHGLQIEKNFYNVNGKLKRFFDRQQLEELFSDWDLRLMEEGTISRFGQKKVLWEITARKMAFSFSRPAVPSKAYCKPSGYSCAGSLSF